MEINSIKAVSGYVIKPLWNKHKTKSGILTDIGYKINDQMPAYYWATEGEVVASKPEWDAQVGDTLYFTYNALSFDNGCISHPDQQNLFVIKHSYYAYRHDGILYTTSEKKMGKTLMPEEYTYALLEPIEEKEEEKLTASGIILSGFAVTGNIISPSLQEKKTKKKLHGKISVLPKVSPFTSLWNPHLQCEDEIQVGLNVVCESTSDVPVTINDKQYYRTRFSEIIYSYHD